jgi:hypothetical protein
MLHLKPFIIIFFLNYLRHLILLDIHHNFKENLNIFIYQLIKRVYINIFFLDKKRK